MKVPISEIKVRPSRFRRDFGDIEGLAASIAKNGLLHPIIVTEDLELVAGERRLRAHKLLGLTEIEVRKLSDLDELSRREIELEENVQRKQFTWQEEVAAKLEIHKIKQAKYGAAIKGHQSSGWGIADTAEALGESVGSVGMDLQLARALEEHPELAKERNKTAAYRKLRQIKEREIRQELARRQAQSGESLPDMYLGDCVAVMQKHIPDESVQLIVTDPPWGIAIDTKSQLARNSVVEYSDTHFNAMQVMDAAFREAYRVLTPGCHMYVFFAIQHYAEVKRTLERAGFQVDPVPIVWDKGSGGAPSTGYSWTNAYEVVFFCWKPDDTPTVKARRRQLNGAPSNVLHHPRVPDRERIHSAQKPVSLLRELIEQSSLPGDTVLDMFGGSGATIKAARQARRRGIYIEIDEPTYVAACEYLADELVSDADIDAASVENNAEEGDD